MSGERPQMLARFRIPETHRTAAADHPLTGCVERDTSDPTWFIGNQRNFLTGLRIVEPNTDRCGDGKSCPARRIFDFMNLPFTQPHLGIFRQMPARVILGEAVERKQSQNDKRCNCYLHLKNPLS